jgi:hypothetical protein
MKAIEVTGIVDGEGNLLLDQPVTSAAHTRVRVIVLYPETLDQSQVNDPDDTPLEEIKLSLRRSLEEATSGQRIPISHMWEELDT